MNEPIRDVFNGITDEQWRGDAPYGRGGMYVLNGVREEAQLYSCCFGGGEVAFGRIGKGQINVGGVCFFVCGLTNPHFRVTKITDSRIAVYDSEIHTPKLFDQKFKKYLKNDVFKTRFGEMFVQQMKNAMDYSLIP